MSGAVDSFSYGLVTPVAAYLMACLGSSLGLRCVTRTVMHQAQRGRAAWLALGAACLGVGIWTMHFIAMMGFQVNQAPITYDVPLTVLSLAVAVAVVSLGVFMVGYRGATKRVLLAAGVLTGLGVAAMHYLGMAALRVRGELHYSVPLVVLSVVIAVIAATAALWAAVSIRGFLPSLAASLVMGIAVSGMHYTGMAAVSVHLHTTGGHSAGQSAGDLLVPMLAGPFLFLVLAAVIVMFDPILVGGDPAGGGTSDQQRASIAVQLSHRPAPYERQPRDVSAPRPDWQ
ncbi:MHYT domain-containing protein [Streptomyces sp. NPDC059894]|uniref:MHYT domain-containing protein n=1 Tax=unclassified Streptomyces TaxID=2593676 RepID=UPI00365E9B03